jgi:hypothetical protein
VVYGEFSASNSNRCTLLLVYFRDTLPLLRLLTSRNAISKFHHSLFHLVSCCLSFPLSLLLIIHKAKINPSPIHDIHLNTGTEVRCDISAADFSSEHVLRALQFSVDISTFLHFLTSLEGVSFEFRLEGRMVCLSELKVKPLSLDPLYVMIHWSLCSSQSEWHKQLKLNGKEMVNFGEEFD